MSKRKWYSRTIYSFVALLMTLGLVLVPAVPAGALVDGVTVEFSPEGSVTEPVRGELTITADFNGPEEPEALEMQFLPPTMFMGNIAVLGQDKRDHPGFKLSFAAAADPTEGWSEFEEELAREMGVVSVAYDGVAMKWTIVIDTLKKVQVCDYMLIALGWMPGQEVWFDGVYTFAFYVVVEDGDGSAIEGHSAAQGIPYSAIFDNPEDMTPELSLNAKGAQQKFWLNWIDRVYVYWEVEPGVWEWASLPVDRVCPEPELQPRDAESGGLVEAGALGNGGGWLWTFDPGVNLGTWGDAASPYDVKVLAGGRPYQDSAGVWHMPLDGYPERFIEIQARAPLLGDFEVAVRLMGAAYSENPLFQPVICEEVASAEKKWGELAFSKLDVHIEDVEVGDDWDDVKAAVEADFGEGLDDDFEEWTGEDHEIEVEAGSPEEPVKEKIAEWVWATFLQLAEPEPAGGAVVHWWLAEDSEENQEWIQDLMDDLVARAEDEGQGGRGHDLDAADSNDYWSATGAYDPAEYPVDIITDWINGTSDEVEKFAVKTDIIGWEPGIVCVEMGNSIAGGLVGAGSSLTKLCVPCDPYLHKDPAPAHTGPIPYINGGGWYGRSITMDYHLNEIPGVSIADVENTGDEDVLIITFVEYQQDYNGENLVLIQIGKKHFKELPPPVQVKTPQIRWAAEKLVLEKDWGKHPYFECGCIYEDPEEPGVYYYGPCPEINFVQDSAGALDGSMEVVGEYFDARVYMAIYNLELGSVGNLEPINELEYLEFEDPEGYELLVNIASIGLPAGAQQVIAPLGGGYYEVGFKMSPLPDGLVASEGAGYLEESEEEEWWNSVSQCIVSTEQCGEVDVNAGLWEVGLHLECIYPEDGYIVVPIWDDGMESQGSSTNNLHVCEYELKEKWFEGPIDNHGFLAYFLDFEEVVLADSDFGATIDVTPEASFQELTPVTGGVCPGGPGEDAEIAVQVKGFFPWEWSHLLPTTRAAELIDVDGDGFMDYILPAGRYVLPDDWWLLAGTRDVTLRPNWDLMDMAYLDDIESLDELGPYDSDVWTTDPPAEAEYPSIGPFNTLQPWSAVDRWIATASVPTSCPDVTDYTVWPQDVIGRNTVVPDGEDLNWTDCPMPQALVIFDIVDSDVPASLSGLDKGDLWGYGIIGDLYQSPFYAVEIPASPYIPGGYNWESWTAYTMPVGPGWALIDGPYDYWTDLMIDSIIADTEEDPVDDQDVEVYCDNHGIAGMQIGAVSEGGYVTITATAEFPYTPKRGKYGPRVSDEITATWGPLDLNPHFVVDDATPDVDQVVEFDPTTTDGGKLPYIVARWDWEGDGVWDITLDLTAVDDPLTPWDDSDPMAIVTHAYDEDGLYWPCLEITDSSTPSVVRKECRGVSDPIIVGAGLTEIVWSCPLGGQPLIAPNPGQGRPFLAVDADPDEITVSPVAAELWGIYWLDEGSGDWYYYIPDFAASTLTTLETDQYYYVVVSGACSLTIPQ